MLGQDRENARSEADRPGKSGREHDGPVERGRNETAEERADRRWTELIQEIRVAQTGVQILFGFLLTVVFTPSFGDLSDIDRNVYIATVALGATATGALIGPVSFHRIVSGRRIKPQAVVWASRLMFTGLVLLLATMVSALFLVLRVATHDHFVPWLVGGVLAWYLICWFLLPMWARHRHTTQD
ncbi:DUF6328 family protein [Streptomyces sp. LP05-1]|uniref:DUF6328 family protein n=1 Tax=Streptomyces pyxinae TaxID=2970734 RepID=A0ABT2CBV4_9ACTN|nr:DUF6328 family protein [Streptomyces sp. LP05-1]MCS0634900.1 DUF6328 family protein [Streptomyces sp. LP05-1]